MRGVDLSARRQERGEHVSLFYIELIRDRDEGGKVTCAECRHRWNPGYVPAVEGRMPEECLVECPKCGALEREEDEW